MTTERENKRFQEDLNMKTTFYINGKKTTRKAVKECVGAERFERIMREAKETFIEDPLIEIDYMISGGTLTICFE